MFLGAKAGQRDETGRWNWITNYTWGEKAAGGREGRTRGHDTHISDRTKSQKLTRHLGNIFLLNDSRSHNTIHKKRYIRKPKRNINLKLAFQREGPGGNGVRRAWKSMGFPLKDSIKDCARGSVCPLDGTGGGGRGWGGFHVWELWRGIELTTRHKYKSVRNYQEKKKGKDGIGGVGRELHVQELCHGILLTTRHKCKSVRNYQSNKKREWDKRRRERIKTFMYRSHDMGLNQLRGVNMSLYEITREKNEER